MWKFEKRGERWRTLRLDGRKKLWRPLVWFVLVLTTLKNRWTLFLNRRDIVIIIRTFGFFDFPFTFICFLPVLSRQWYAAPITEEKNVTPRTVLLWCIHMYMYTYITKCSRSKILFVFFFLFFVSHVVVYQESGMKIGKRREENIFKK